MGDRANIAIKQYNSEERVWLYGHWIGARTIEVARTVIDRRVQLADSSYLARVIFEAMIPEDQHGDSMGYGISTQITDNEYPIIVFDPNTQTIQIEESDGTPLTPAVSYVTFADRAVTGDFDKTIKRMWLNK